MFDKMGAGVRKILTVGGALGLMSCAGLFGAAQAESPSIEKDTVSFNYVTELDGEDMSAVEAALEHIVVDMTHAENWTDAKLKGAVVELPGDASLQAHLYCGKVCFYVKPIRATTNGRPLMAILSGKLIKVAPVPVSGALKHAP